jgi:hypothetical protein
MRRSWLNGGLLRQFKNVTLRVQLHDKVEDHTELGKTQGTVGFIAFCLKATIHFSKYVLSYFQHLYRAYFIILWNDQPVHNCALAGHSTKVKNKKIK